MTRHPSEKSDMADKLAEMRADRDSLRDALAALVRIYVTEGAAVTPATDIGAAWDSARHVLGSKRA